MNKPLNGQWRPDSEVTYRASAWSNCGTEYPAGGREWDTDNLPQGGTIAPWRTSGRATVVCHTAIMERTMSPICIWHAKWKREHTCWFAAWGSICKTEQAALHVLHMPCQALATMDRWANPEDKRKITVVAGPVCNRWVTTLGQVFTYHCFCPASKRHWRESFKQHDFKGS